MQANKKYTSSYKIIKCGVPWFDWLKFVMKKRTVIFPFVEL